MSSEPQNPPMEQQQHQEHEEGSTQSKKAAKKEAAKLEKLRRREEKSASGASAADAPDPLAANYGDVPLEDLQSKAVSGRKWIEIANLNEELKDQNVLIRGRAHAIRSVSKKMAFLVVRERGFTVQCVLSVAPDVVSLQMVKFATGLSKESYVDVEGTISVPKDPIIGASQQQVEIQVKKLYCITKAVPALPINIEDAARSEIEIEKALQAGKQLVRVNQDTRLNFRVLDLRTPANQGIFRVQCQVENVMDIVDRLFVAMFDSLNEKCQKELEAIGKQYPFEPLKYLRKTLRLTFQEGVQMLKEAGVEIDPLGDLNTESERKLGQLVLEKYGTEFYILHRYPLAVRPFYTMPCSDDPAYSNSFDVFIRGEEIISGAQRVHVPEFLATRAEACGIDVKTISTYIDSFGYGAPLHGGFGVGLERVVMLFCALNNIRKTSLFPRDPLRIAP
ncbi:Aspartate--tRNA ligase 2, cytoplasmic [Camellia lanceoleosa]|uniref:Aspartate--tRNA ligase 2, cytoplasmic n=1 Tax=Camellia lanceoleosa TaxID=1840588 RepID=A0ACC0F6S8_9ERIC|nr:Aspartate--tRNA ligase 2, cytoplasmic [Camellia lanceoleosa]